MWYSCASAGRPSTKPRVPKSTEGVIGKAKGNLILSRNVGERICIGDDIVIEIDHIDRYRVKIRFFAPTSVRIDREEVRARQRAEHEAPKCRTVEDVLRARRENAAAGGCCNRWADMSGCDCLERARRSEP